MVPAGNKAKRLSSVNHTTKTNYHHHHQIMLKKVFWCFQGVSNGNIGQKSALHLTKSIVE